MNNKELINEGFFKKSYKDQLEKKYTQYAPIDKMGRVSTGLNAISADNKDQIKKRLTQTLGVALGNNTVKNMASKAIKKFPIIISDQVDPSTAVLLKNYLETQYAEYINLLISNQIIDLNDYERNSDKGNIAIQALDQITGADFGKQKIANKALTGELDANDLFSNVPIYQLIRQESTFVTGDENVDNILENAIIIDSEKANELIESMILLTESTAIVRVVFNNGVDSDKSMNIEKDNILDKAAFPDLKKDGYKFLGWYVDGSKWDFSKPITKNITIEAKWEELRSGSGRGTEGLHARKINTFGNYALDSIMNEPSVDETIGELLLKPNASSRFLKDRFEKATWLLQSRLIAGSEYAAYLIHLGIPVRKEVHRELIRNFPARELIVLKGENFGKNDSRIISDTDAKMISKGKKYVPKVVSSICKTKVRDVFKTNVAIAGGSGAVVTGAIVAAIAGLTNPAIGIGLLAGGVTGAGAAILRNLQKHKNVRLEKVVESTNSWERVEALIQEMDDQTYRLKIDAAKWNLKFDEKRTDNEFNIVNVAKKELLADQLFDFSDLYNDKNRAHKEVPQIGLNNPVAEFKQGLMHIYESSTEAIEGYFEDPINLSESSLDVYQEATDLLTEDGKVLLEKIAKVSLMKPGYVSKAKDNKLNLTVLKYDDKKDFVVPSYGAADRTAYGSVEYDRRELKDRKFNTPLIMTVKFKERYSDGSYADNELTAVIGILGVITRIPSEEMEYILKTNAEGTTLKGIFSGDDKGSLADLFTAYKNKNDYSKLTQSADTWKNLEKISQLAMANKMAGKLNNNVANAHIIFSQKEVDAVRQETGHDYTRDRKISAGLMKRYSAMNLMIANDTLERVFIFNDIDSASWDVVPYDAIRGRDSSDLMASIANKFR